MLFSNCWWTKSSRPEGPKAGPKGQELEVGAQHAPRLLVNYIIGVFVYMLALWNSSEIIPVQFIWGKQKTMGFTPFGENNMCAQCTLKREPVGRAHPVCLWTGRTVISHRWVCWRRKVGRRRILWITVLGSPSTSKKSRNYGHFPYAGGEGWFKYD